MKIEVWGEKEKSIEKQPLRLRLVRNDTGVSLIAVDEEGNRVAFGHILQIDTYGYIRCNGDVTNKFGLQLDAQGRVKLGSSI